MKMKKILVIGCPGGGKSSFARELHKRTSLPLCHLDMLFWNADKTTVTRELLCERVREVLSGDEWIIDGNYSATLPMRLEACDTVFFLDMPTELCLRGVEKRRGQVRPDMPWIETEEDPEFTEYIKSFKEVQRPKLLEIISQYSDKALTVFHSHEEIDAYLARLDQGYESISPDGIRSIKTPRLTLDIITDVDEAELTEIFKHDKVKATYMLPDLDDGSAHALFERIRDLSHKSDRYVRGIYLDGRLIGLINDTEIDGKSIEMGYALHPEHHSRGYMSEAFSAMIDYLFSCGFDEVTAGAFEENAASIRVMQKCGMTRLDKTDEIDYRGKTHRCIYFSIKSNKS
jgi:RimJ/RimL family protein N-acetyltransferase